MPKIWQRSWTHYKTGEPRSAFGFRITINGRRRSFQSMGWSRAEAEEQLAKALSRWGNAVNRPVPTASVAVER
jgi:hypothetical protein